MVTPNQVAGQLRVNRKNNIDKECMVVLNKFLERQALDYEFFYTFEIDEDNVCRSIFWADGRARNAYLKFCDVIAFDVTYKTNSFLMPFAPFTGVNHHRQSTLSDCDLLADEREEMFVWLFKQWLRCMWDKAPRAIITDQDVAIGNAIKRVFPHAHHRYCSWHLSLHEDEHIRSLHSIPEFDELYTRWAKKSKSIEESEQCWNTLKGKKPSFVGILSEKQRNVMKAWKWLEYEQGHHWVKAYLRGTFFVGRKVKRSMIFEDVYMFQLFKFLQLCGSFTFCF
ncbi:PREDICTED: protein FAR1-RELATED SEQUENCE 12-like [Lupinus angustifolius]|uniref:protein FAR1-RELATED SEQUENCE 12-like n=1 Tax=Lupinus angustifolius TaxID=3871 RepID=UPI00092FA449|nr:PREDICTED: protein FAR1-RELATED SEQUENCE 12-like [Lupinus angustifolius]